MDTMPTGRDLELLRERIMRRVTVSSAGCWEVPPAKGTQGYAIMRMPNGMRKVHRIMYQISVRPLLDTEPLHHRCENPCCCNPSHLEPTDPMRHNTELHPSNIAYRYKRQETCKHGHPLTPDNLAPYNLRKRRERACKVCRRARYREWFAKNRDKVRAEHKRWYAQRGRALRGVKNPRT